LILVTGPARSGKSEWAEAIALQSKASVVYVATAQTDPADLEWQARIDQHRQRRPADWNTLEVPLELAATLQQAPKNSCLLVDSLGTWLANHLQTEPAVWAEIRDQLLCSLTQSESQVILVAEETGWGLVPAYPLGRSFRDRLGDLVRRIGAIADPVYLVTGGYALNLTQLGTPLPMEGTLNQSNQTS
jgi:adenosylcobinamide kinase / adenosylcobinamide-phosphate guanylyltransferase